MVAYQIENIYKYIKIYNNSKENSKNTRFFINNYTDVKIGIIEKKDEIIISFYSSKSSFSFIRGYSQYKQSLNNEVLNEIEKSARSFNEYIRQVKPDPTMIYFRNIKLNNPFRNIPFSKDMFDNNENDITNYINFNLDKKKYYIHSGFIELFNSISEFYYMIINNYLKSTNKKIILIGFSFSTVIVRIAYLAYILAHPKELHRIEAYLYSTPNMGNSYFEKFYAKLHAKEKDRRLYIINCNNDAVYNLLSKRFGFYKMKSTLLIKKTDDKNNKHIYTSRDYEKIIEKIVNYNE